MVLRYDTYRGATEREPKKRGRGRLRAGGNDSRREWREGCVRGEAMLNRFGFGEQEVWHEWGRAKTERHWGLDAPVCCW